MPTLDIQLYPTLTCENRIETVGWTYDRTPTPHRIPSTKLLRFRERIGCSDLWFLCVVNHNNQVVVIITRKDLLPEALTDSLLRGRNAHINEVAEREAIERVL